MFEATGLANPWPWALGAAVSLGLGLGCFGRALLRRLGGRSRGDGRGSALSVLGMVLLAAAVLFATGLLVFPEKASLLDPPLRLSMAVAAGLGLGAGLLPRALGLPLLFALASTVAYVAVCLGGWLPLEGSKRIATLTPFVVSSSGWSGELGVEEKDSVPIIQAIAGKGSDVRLVVERLELSGPVALVAGPEWYRVVGTASGAQDEAAETSVFSPPARLLDIALPIGPGLGAAASLPFARRWREGSSPVALVALVPIRFSLGPGTPGGELRVEGD